MSDIDQRRLEEIFGEVLEMEPEARKRYLDDVGSEDSEFRRRVETLIRADAAAGTFLEAAAEIPTATAAGPSLKPGDQVGAYRILTQIGEGGMGAVFLAERDDGTFTRQVAIKVLRRGIESRSAIDRFEQERQILASLDHPGIARLLDGGTTASGTPYVVMEYIEGKPIDQACEDLGLSIQDRLDLMILVCEAVTAAHRRLVVHRDLKPSNILINKEGAPKLLDFGIAKWLDADSSLATATWDRRLTPSYASPEQLRGENISVATDVYLLGVILYKLLTGALPYKFEKNSLLEVERLVTSEPPPRPSSVASGLDADLDAIILKALRHEPEARYGSVEGLASDLKRYRQGLPVLARQGNRRYHIGKFLHRHRLPLAAFLFVLALVATFTVSTFQQAQEIERTLGRLIAVEGVLGNLFENIDPRIAKGREVPVIEVLERGERWLELNRDLQEPGSRALLHALFGRMSFHLASHKEARAHFENALTALEAVDPNPYFATVEVRTRSELARTLAYLGEDRAITERMALEALEEGRKIPHLDVEEHLGLLDTVVNLYCWRRQWKLAEPYVQEAIALVDGRQDAAGLDLTTASIVSKQALLLKNLTRDPEAARQAYQKSLEMYLQLEGEIYPEVANIEHQLAVLASERGDLEVAMAKHQKALKIRRELYPSGHKDIVQSLFELGIVYRKAGKLKDAETMIEEGWTFFAEDPDYGPSHGRTLLFWIFLAEIRNELGRPDEAKSMLDELSPEWWEQRKPRDRLLPIAQRALGCVLVDRGEFQAAAELLQDSAEAFRQQRGEDHWDTQLTRKCLARIPRNIFPLFDQITIDPSRTELEDL